MDGQSMSGLREGMCQGIGKEDMIAIMPGCLDQKSLKGRAPLCKPPYSGIPGEERAGLSELGLQRRKLGSSKKRIRGSCGRTGAACPLWGVCLGLLHTLSEGLCSLSCGSQTSPSNNTRLHFDAFGKQRS